MTFWSFIISKVIEVVVLLLILFLGWFSKVENRFVLLEVPHNDLSILASTCQDVGYHTIPTDRGYSRSFMIVRDTGFEDIRRLNIVLNILNEDLCSSRCKKILFVRVELD